VYPDGREEEMLPKEVLASVVQQVPSGKSFTGMFPDEVYPHYRYIFPDGKVYEDAVQASPWSSGPVIFLALRDENGDWVPESLWPQEAVDFA